MRIGAWSPFWPDLERARLAPQAFIKLCVSELRVVSEAGSKASMLVVRRLGGGK